MKIFLLLHFIVIDFDFITFSLNIYEYLTLFHFILTWIKFLFPFLNNVYCVPFCHKFIPLL